jgi:ParB family transcriptional regulator, chromosome partitioning protein
VTVRRGLGRGLGALIPAAPPAHEDVQTESPQSLAAADGDSGDSLPAGAYFTEVQIGRVRPNPRQPRTSFDDDALQELADSLALVGLLQPVVVRPAPDGFFELVMGERRWRAAQLAGLPQIPAIVRRTVDADLLRDALLENLHRADLNALEEAAAYQQLLEDFNVTKEELATRIGRSRPHVSNTIRLLRLSPAVQRRVAAGVLSAGHARALLSVDDAAAQERLAARVVAEGLSVRALEELVAAPLSTPSTRRRSPQPTRAAELSEVADRLSERFETRCTVALGRRKGKITIEFATLGDLQRIVETIETDAGIEENRNVDLSTSRETFDSTRAQLHEHLADGGSGG